VTFVRIDTCCGIISQRLLVILQLVNSLFYHEA
jgi:hypothetical protein